MGRDAREAICLDCGNRMPMREVLDRVRAGEEDPTCWICGGMEKSAKIVIVTGEATEFDDVADAVVRGHISEILAELVR